MDPYLDLGGNTPLYPVRPGPPQPLGPGIHYFPVSAATPLALTADTHPSGYSIRIKLDNPHPDNPFRTNELISGQLKIYSSANIKRLVVPRLSLRVYFESRTLFAGLQLKQGGGLGQKIESMKSIAAQDYDNVIMHEVHRGVVPSESLTLSWDPQSQLDALFEPGNQYSEISLPFSFVIPHKMTTLSPPTLRDSEYGSVQWVVEAIMDLVPNPEREKDEMMLFQPTDQQVLTRLVFPVMPAPEDTTSLRTDPFFGDDMEKQMFGSRRLSDEEVESGKKAILARGGKWEVYVREIAVLEKHNIWCEIYVNAGAQLSTNASVFPLILLLKHTGSRGSSLPSFLRSSKQKAPKTMHLVRAVVTIRSKTSTRGGKEIKPHVRSTIIRKHVLRFDSNSTTPGIAIPNGDVAPLEVDLTFDVQSQEEMDLGSRKLAARPARNLTPSFRTPNIEYEYYMTMSLLFAGDEVERIPTQFPVQVVPSNSESQLAPFQDTLPEYTAN